MKKASNILQIGTTGDYPPFSKKESDSYIGFDIDIITQFSYENNYEIELIETSWQSLNDDLNHNKFQIVVGGISLTEYRKKRFLCSLPIINNAKIALIHKDNRNKYTELKQIDLNKTRVIYNPGGTNDHFVHKNIKHAKLIKCVQIENIFKLLIDKKVDIFFTDFIEAIYRQKKYKELIAINTEHPFTFDKIGYIFSKESKLLQKNVNKWLNNFLSKPEFKKLLKKWDLQSL